MNALFLDVNVEQRSWTVTLDYLATMMVSVRFSVSTNLHLVGWHTNVEENGMHAQRLKAQGFPLFLVLRVSSLFGHDHINMYLAMIMCTTTFFSSKMMFSIYLAFYRLNYMVVF